MTWDTINTLTGDEERDHWYDIRNLICDKTDCIIADYDYGQICTMLRHSSTHMAQRGAEILYDIICRNGYGEDVYYYGEKGRLTTIVSYNRPAIAFTPYTKRGRLSKKSETVYYPDSEAQAIGWLARQIRPVEED